MTSLLQLSLRQIGALYAQKKLSPVEVTQACLKQALKYNPAFNAFALLDEHQALRAAKASEKRWMKGAARGSLDGIPVTVKDWLHVKGWPTRYGSSVSSSLKQPEDSPAVARLREAGTIFLGKTTLPEYGHKGVTDNALTGVTRNPWNMNKTSGGSSGGAGVAAACGMGLLHLGSDAGGSIRIPASFCGVFGFKPSPRLVPSWPAGLFSEMSSIGVLTRTADDAALAMDMITRPDARDWHALPLPPADFAGVMNNAIPKLRIAYAGSINGITATPAVAQILQTAIKALKKLGTVDEIDLQAPHLVSTFNRHWAAAASYMVASFSAKDRKKLDPRLLYWAEAGDGMNLHDYLQARLQRETIGAYFKSLLDTYDLIITPTTAMSAFDVGQNMPMDAKGKAWDDWTPFTYPANMAGLPAASIPAGMTKEGLPAGLQIIAGFLKDALVLQVAKQLESEIVFKPWLHSIE